LQLALAGLPPDEQRVLTLPGLRHTAPAAARCRALIGFARSILALPLAERAVALRSIYTSTAPPDA
jgi:hypothetical protein